MEVMSGLYLELVFLDGFLNFGQGLFTFAVFGFDVEYVSVPVRRMWRRVLYGGEALVLPEWEDLEAETKRTCNHFLVHHVAQCVESIVKDVECEDGTVWRAVFRGCELVDWLIEFGLARDRSDAVAFGRHLIKGRVIRHVIETMDFHDEAFLYTVSPTN